MVSQEGINNATASETQSRHALYVRTRRVSSQDGAVKQNANRHRRRDQDNAQELVRLAILVKFAIDLRDAPLAAKAARYAQATAGRLVGIGEAQDDELPEVDDLLGELREQLGLTPPAENGDTEGRAPMGDTRAWPPPHPPRRPGLDSPRLNSHSWQAALRGRKRQSEGTCRRPAGWGTDHPGFGRCKLHGGRGAEWSAGVEAAAGGAPGAEPRCAAVDRSGVVLQEALSRAYGDVVALGQRIEESRDGVLVQTNLVTGTEETGVWRVMYERALDRWARIAKECAALGLAAHQTGLSEHVGEAIVAVLTDVVRLLGRDPADDRVVAALDSALERAEQREAGARLPVVEPLVDLRELLAEPAPLVLEAAVELVPVPAGAPDPRTAGGWPGEAARARDALAWTSILLALEEPGLSQASADHLVRMVLAQLSVRGVRGAAGRHGTARAGAHPARPRPDGRTARPGRAGRRDGAGA